MGGLRDCFRGVGGWVGGGSNPPSPENSQLHKHARRKQLLRIPKWLNLDDMHLHNIGYKSFFLSLI